MKNGLHGAQDERRPRRERKQVQPWPSLGLFFYWACCLQRGRGGGHGAPHIPVHLDPASCPPSFRQHPLILVSMDGFRANYINRGLTPNIQALGRLGVRAPFMKPSYPTITFPNHYTIATGMYPPSHGIIANRFYDPEFDAVFRIGRPESFEPRWWGGEPIWKTVERQGKRAATFFWPGSEVKGQRATYWFYYNGSIPYPHRVDQVLDWLDLPEDKRPLFMTLYMDEPDRAGHDFGPDSTQVNAKLAHVDEMIGRLIKGLQARNLLSCVNIILVADHGMVEAGQNRAIRLDQYIPNVVNRTRFWSGIFGRMTPNDGKEETKQAMMNSLSCRRPELRVYERTSLPARWHMGSQRRVEDIVVDLDPGFSVGGDASFMADAGDHGYDNYFAVMNALFVAHGPDLRRNLEVETFQNIELYNLMCHLLGVTPAPNNGTWGSLNHLLVSPSPVPQPRPEYPPPVAAVPSEEVLEYYRPKPLCEGDLQKVGELLEVLEEAQEDAYTLTAKHLPWGPPEMGRHRDSSLLLLQQDFINGYSTHLRLPLWSSFTLGIGATNIFRYPWRSDVRLKAHHRISCSEYTSLANHGLFPHPLFPPEFTSKAECGQLAFLASNTVPISSFLGSRWSELLGFVHHWARRYSTINVVLGPVFDYDADSFADDPSSCHRSSVPVPTHMFMVVSRCLQWVHDLSDCPYSQVDALAFIYPQHLAVSNCLSAERFAQEFSAKVQDVEKITGLRFFSHMPHEDQVRLRVRMHSNIWGRESWGNRLHSRAYHLFK
ncbi:venom phosphodiesterase 2-like [Portunus trituberculatus]|uniref:venom phosphodiesterase 2-like n=1 Tax=Portunus trituberculatus TaxID=210409 RepID=UPI001E1D12D8|nr:venom phosphodiesterase 2-like [Portunus trituberculatus]